jgi:peroxiredoxin
LNLFLAVSYGLLWLIVLVLGVAVMVLYRYVGMSAIDKREQRLHQGPPADQRPPAHSVTATDGTTVRLGDPEGRPQLVYFASTTCSHCGPAWEALARFTELFAGEIDVVLIVAGRPKDVEYRRTQSGLRSPVVIDNRRHVNEKWGSSRYPGRSGSPPMDAWRATLIPTPSNS